MPADCGLVRAVSIQERKANVDAYLIVLRIVHIGAAMLWFGGAIVSAFFLDPTVRALGPAGAPFMDHLMNRRRMGIYFPIVAGLTVLSGILLYWRDSAGLQMSWITSGPGLAFTVGGLAALVAFVGGMMLIPPAVGAQTEVANELAASGGAPSEEQQDRLEWAERRMRLVNRIDLPLLLLAALAMAVARYV